MNTTIWSSWTSRQEIDCAILGDAVYKIVWDGESREVRITAPDIQGVFVWWVGDDVSRVWRVASRYSLSEEEVELLYGNSKSEYRISKQIPNSNNQNLRTIVEVWTDKVFELYIDGLLVEKKTNPYGFIPFIIFQNLREPKKFWGISDVTPLMEPQRELNRAFSQVSHILELSGNPWQYWRMWKSQPIYQSSPAPSGTFRKTPRPIY
jgi:hypothetical protein